MTQSGTAQPRLVLDPANHIGDLAKAARGHRTGPSTTSRPKHEAVPRPERVGNTYSQPGRAASLQPQQPQRVEHLYAELLFGTCSPRRAAENRAIAKCTAAARRWGGYAPSSSRILKTGAQGGVAALPNPMRWHPPTPTPPVALDFVTGLRTMVVNGDADAQTGMAAHLALIRPMAGTPRLRQCRWRDAADPADGHLRVSTDARRARPGRDRAAAAAWPSGGHRCPASAYVCENYGARSACPSWAPSATVCQRARLRNPAAAWFDETPGYQMVKVSLRPALAPTQPKHSPSTWSPGTANRRAGAYDTRHFNTIGSISYDHPDPSSSPVLTSPSGHARHRQLRLRDLSAALAGDGPGHLPTALVPPQPDERIHGPVWPSTTPSPGLSPGGMSCTTACAARAPDAEAFEKAPAATWRRTSWTTRWPSCSRAAGAFTDHAWRPATGGTLDTEYTLVLGGAEPLREPTMKPHSPMPRPGAAQLGGRRTNRRLRLQVQNHRWRAFAAQAAASLRWRGHRRPDPDLDPAATRALAGELDEVLEP